MDMYTQLVCYRFELTRILLNKKNISKDDFLFIRKSLINIKDMCYRIKSEKDFNCEEQANEIKEFILNKNPKKVGR